MEEPVPFVGNLDTVLHHLLLSTLRRIEKLSAIARAMLQRIKVWGNFPKDQSPLSVIFILGCRIL